MLLITLFLVFQGAVVLVLLNTLWALYPGTSDHIGGPPEETVQVSASRCWRVGPFASYRIGYWTTCQATVLRADGSRVEATVDRSVLDTDDVGTSVSLVEACYSESKTDCTYGRPRDILWRIWPSSVRILMVLDVVLYGGLVYQYGRRMVVGAPKYFDYVDRRLSRRSQRKTK